MVNNKIRTWWLALLVSHVPGNARRKVMSSVPTATRPGWNRPSRPRACQPRQLNTAVPPLVAKHSGYQNWHRSRNLSGADTCGSTQYRQAQAH